MRIDWPSLIKKKSPDPKHQFPLGMVVFKGYQGNGKSLSLVHKAFDIKKSFPDCKVYSNMKLYGIRYNLYSTTADLISVLSSVRNGNNGVLIIIDEAQNYFNKKDGVPLEIMSQLCQNRKNRRCVLMTSQIWEDLDVMLRKQVKTIVNCRRIFNIQINTYHNGEALCYDKQAGEYVAPKKFTEIFKHNNEYYKRYETLEVIDTNKNYNRTLTMAQGAPPAPVNVNIKSK